MPEISQEKFESLYPADPPATPEELRARANSITSNNTNSMYHRASITSDVTSSAGVSTTSDEILKARSSTRQLRLLSETSNGGDPEMMNSFVEFNNEPFHSYKREISHR